MSSLFLPLLLARLALAAPTCDPRGLVCVEARPMDSPGAEYWVTSKAQGSVTLRVDARLENMESSAPFPVTAVLRGPVSRRIAVVSPLDFDSAWRHDYSFVYQLGDYRARHDDKTVYALPFARGEKVRVSQGYHGKLSHTGHDEYALDFDVPMGTPVLAAREGVVVDVVQENTKGAFTPEMLSGANVVVVEHADRTLGEYVHLMFKGSYVKVGQKVVPGFLLGYSGDTGKATGPHLHFAVYKPIDGASIESLPVKFDVGAAKPEELKEGGVYSRR